MIVEQAPAKLNLALHVRARRPDGYHELETLFVFVRDGDTLTLAPADQDSFEVTGAMAGALSGEGDNLVTRARDRFRAEIAQTGPLAIRLEKRLPVASGLGGGSADAAATLRAMARMSGVALDDPRLFACAAALGSDIPACLLGLSAIGTGRGEELVEVAGPGEWAVLLVNPRVAVPTGPVFAAWDRVDRGPLPEGSALDIAMQGRNDLQPPAIAIAPVIGEVLAELSACEGVKLARMSGSGATCFALFVDEDARTAAARAIEARHPDWWCLETALA